MTPNELVDMAVTAVRNRPASMVNYYHLCWWENKLQCLPEDHTNEPHYVFGLYSTNTLRDRLTTPRWQELREQLWYFWQNEKKQQ